jgi:hypothetical protein
MITLSASTAADLEQLTEWIAHDPYHFHQGQPEWWLTGAEGSLLAFCLNDARGPLSFVRLDAEGEYVRIHTQFAPDAIVSKRRLVVGMIECMKKLIELYKAGGKKGMVFNSINPGLVAFMDNRLGFKPVGNDDYVLEFKVEKTV